MLLQQWNYLIIIERLFAFYVQMQMCGGSRLVNEMREEHQISVNQETEKYHAQTGDEVICLHQAVEVCECYHNNVGVNISYHSILVALPGNII